MRNNLPARDFSCWPGYLLGLFCLCAGSLAAQPAEKTNRAPIAVWDATVRVTAGFGYRDNVLRSSVTSESSESWSSWLIQPRASILRATSA